MIQIQHLKVFPTCQSEKDHPELNTTLPYPRDSWIYTYQLTSLWEIPIKPYIVCIYVYLWVIIPKDP